MAIVQFGGESHVSKPVKRIRWATQRAPGQSGAKKRLSILSRQKRRSGVEAPPSVKPSQDAENAPAEEAKTVARSEPRTIYVNVPLPDDAKDEQGHIEKPYVRNKIRTSKYTPLSFIPKNLYFQFHNIANIYFFFIIILSVSGKANILVALVA